jgi:hypothetical protein
VRRGYIILLSGTVLLVAGIAISAVWGVSFAGSFLKENTIVAKTTIGAGKSISATTDVNELGRPISLAVGIDRNGQLSQSPASPSPNSSDVMLKEIVTGPDGKVVSSNEFAGSFLSSFNPEVTGAYTVTITNMGTKPVTISGTFGHLAFIRADGKPDVNAMVGAGGQGFGMIILGGVLAVVGIITLIVGGIVTALDSRAKGRDSATSTGPGGVTYRKD